MHDLQGKIRQDGSGFATFKATFQCITFRPFKGEVLDCVVSQVNKVCCVDRQLGAVRGPVRLTWVLWGAPQARQQLVELIHDHSCFQLQFLELQRNKQIPKKSNSRR
jgi:hypothetical protein